MGSKMKIKRDQFVGVDCVSENCSGHGKAVPRYGEWDNR